MGDTTNNLISLARDINDIPNKREMDMLLSTGEQVSIALIAMAIQAKGHECISLTGNQAGIFTDEVYSNAKIMHINNARILKELKNGKIIIVAGFRCITQMVNISTLWQWLPDTTAFALAAR
jgi:aspartate kinase